MSATCVSAQAQTYPTREIRVVVGLPAGSGGDVVARFYADKLSQLAGKPVIVENRPGMILSIGADAVAKAPPDGYTILITSVTSSHAANLFNFKKLPYDPIKDFTPVATLQKSYFMLMVRAEAPWKTVAELTEAMKTKGDKASYGYGAPPALGVGRALQGPQGPEGGRHSLQDLDGLAAGDVQRRTRFPVHRLHRGHAAAARAARCARSRSPPDSACPVSIFRPWPRPPTFRSSTSRRCGACCCRRERPRRSSRGWKRGSPKSAGWTPPGSIMANTHAAPFPATPRHLADFIPKEIKKWEELAKLAKIEPQ